MNIKMEPWISSPQSAQNRAAEAPGGTWCVLGRLGGVTMLDLLPKSMCIHEGSSGGEAMLHPAQSNLIVCALQPWPRSVRLRRILMI